VHSPAFVVVVVHVKLLRDHLVSSLFCHRDVAVLWRTELHRPPSKLRSISARHQNSAASFDSKLESLLSCSGKDDHGR
jgi:hypothetical protein